MKILVVVDKSEESQQALRYTCHLLEHFEADVDALYVKPDLVASVAETSYAPSPPGRMWKRTSKPRRKRPWRRFLRPARLPGGQSAL